MLIYNIATGNFTPGFDTPGIIAHSEHLWNILGMYAVGFAAVLAGRGARAPPVPGASLSLRDRDLRIQR